MKPRDWMMGLVVAAWAVAWAAVCPARASEGSAAGGNVTSAMTRQTIKAFIVMGTVTVAAKGGPARSLNRGDMVPVGATVKAGSDGTALLAFSNGAVAQMRPNAELVVKEYTQTDFDEAKLGTYLRLDKEPSTSQTELELKAGTVVTEVRGLEKASGSRFIMDTLVGDIGAWSNTTVVTSFSISRDPKLSNVQQVSIGSVLGRVLYAPKPVVNVQERTATIDPGFEAKVMAELDPGTDELKIINLSGAAMSRSEAKMILQSLYAQRNAAYINGTPVPVPELPDVWGNTKVTDRYHVDGVMRPPDMSQVIPPQFRAQ